MINKGFENFLEDDMVTFMSEVLSLKSITENNGWHNHETVFDHTSLVVSKLDKIINQLPEKIINYLDVRIVNFLRKDILFLATLLHDIGKREINNFSSDKNSQECDHGYKSADIAKQLMNKINISDLEKNIAIKIIKNHSAIHLLLDKDKYSDYHLNQFKKMFSDIYFELIILGNADILAMEKCVKSNSINDYNFRIDFFKRELK